MDIFNLNQTIIPFGLLEIAHRFEQMRPGQLLDIIGLDAAGQALLDLKRILPVDEYEISGGPLLPGSGFPERLRIIKKKRRASSGLQR